MQTKQKRTRDEILLSILALIVSVLLLVTSGACARNLTSFGFDINENEKRSESQVPDVLPNLDYFAERSLSVKYGQKRRAVDIILISENSGSMAPYIDQVVSNAEVFVNSLVQKGIDFQLGMLKANPATDPASVDLFGSHAVITNQSGRAATEMRENLQELKNSAPGGDETPLTTLYRGVQSSSSHSMFRSGVPKMFIILSDAEELRLTDSDRAKVFADIDQQLGHASWRIVSISSPSSNPCPLDGAGLEPARVVESYTLASGGKMGRICDADYASILTDAVEQIFSLVTEISLGIGEGEELVEDELHVLVDGVEIARDAATGFAFNQQTKSVYFPGSYQPQPGQNVEVRFVVHVL